MIFPSTKAKNLLGSEVTLPADLDEDFGCILLGFYRRHQRDIDSWIPLLEEFRKEKSFTYYELPVIGKANRLYRAYLDTVMRIGIRDNDVNARTITIYEDSTEFLSKLNQTSTEEIYVYLITSSGEILHMSKGRYRKEEAEIFRSFLYSS